jgi:hypothetical protein
MARRRSALEQFRRDLYLTQRTIGDYQAAQRGTLIQRLLRRQLRRVLGRGLSRRGL